LAKTNFLQFPRMMVVCFLTCMILGHASIFGIYGQREDNNKDDDPEIAGAYNNGPFLTDPNLKIEEIAEGLRLPTTMAFLGQGDILILEKDQGTIRRILNGRLLDEPVLNVNVANENERGMLGIAISTDKGGIDIDKGYASPKTYVYVYFTEAEDEGNDECDSSRFCDDDSPEPFGNRLYRYEWTDGKLINPELLLDLPGTPGPGHNGGAISIGPDGNIYVGIGDVRGSSQNPTEKGKIIDGRSGILRITQDGQPVGKGILGGKHPLNFYYAYGIRNIFGIDFDPVTGKLWDTENGADCCDETNLVEPGFNSGWNVVQGMFSDDENKEEKDAESSQLEDFNGKGKYSDPELVWEEPVGLTGLKFLDSNQLGDDYVNDLIVGDVHRGNLYHFELNEDRTKLMLGDIIKGKTIENYDAADELRFGGNFGGITDLKVGPDGYLYIVSIGLGKIFRIVPEVND
jgi:aldose sugar dehydrogenase